MQRAVDVVGRTYELDRSAVRVARRVDDLRDVDRVDARLLAADAAVGEERRALPRRDVDRLAVDGNLLGLVRSEAREAVVGDELEIHRRGTRSLLRCGERPVLEGVIEEATVAQHLLVLLHELLVDARPQLVAHHDVDHGRRDRNGRSDGERCRERKPQAERHGSRST